MHRTTTDSDSCTPALVVTLLLALAATVFMSYPNYLEVSSTDYRLVFAALVPIIIGLVGWPFIRLARMNHKFPAVGVDSTASTARNARASFHSVSTRFHRGVAISSPTCSTLHALATKMCDSCGLAGRPVRVAVRRPGWVVLLLAAFLLNLSGIVAAYWLQWTNFTYGDQVLSEGLPRIAPWALAGSLLAGVICWEFVLRRVVVGLWVRAGAPRWGVVFACTLGILLAVPSVLQGLEVTSIFYVTVGLFRLLCLEIACTAIALRGPGVIWAGCYRGLLFFADTWVIGDWYSPLFPGVNYVASGGLDYWVYGGGVLLATMLMVNLSLRVK